MSEEQNTDTIGALKTRVANMLINTVSLSETINILRDFCVKRGEELVDNATEEQLEISKNKLTTMRTQSNSSKRWSSKLPLRTHPVPLLDPQQDQRLFLILQGQTPQEDVNQVANKLKIKNKKALLEGLF